jgi:hypothetical protein
VEHKKLGEENIFGSATTRKSCNKNFTIYFVVSRIIPIFASAIQTLSIT